MIIVLPKQLEYIPILYCTLLKFIDRSSGGRSREIAVSLALLLLAVVVGIMLAAAPPPQVLLGWSPQLV